jgi:hypothetical protein
MTNTLLHRVERLDVGFASSVKELQDLLGAMQGPGRDDRPLHRMYRVELLCETLSDGSQAMSVRLTERE